MVSFKLIPGSSGEEGDKENTHFKRMTPEMLYKHVTVTVCFSSGFKIMWMTKVFKNHCSFVQSLQLCQEGPSPSSPPNPCKTWIPREGRELILLWCHTESHVGRAGTSVGLQVCAELTAWTPRHRHRPPSFISSPPAISGDFITLSSSSDANWQQK